MVDLTMGKWVLYPLVAVEPVRRFRRIRARLAVTDALGRPTSA